MKKRVIERPEVFDAVIWEGNNLEEFSDTFDRYDFSIREDGRLLAKKVGTLDTCCMCDENEEEVICKKDVILQSLLTGELNKITIEVFAKDYVEIHPPEKNDGPVPENITKE